MSLQRSQLLGVIRLGFFLSGLVFFFLTTLAFLPLMYAWPLRIRPIIVAQLKFYCQYCLLFMGIRVKKKGKYQAIIHQRPQLVVCNHLSYIDVLILGALNPTAFVTSVEIKETPFLGPMAILGGCVFVERRSRTNLSSEIAEITDSLKNGVSVTIFPEATSTNGREVLRFKRPLFRAAYDAKVDILPITINYKRLGGVDLNYKNKDFVFWYGDMTFGDHLWNFFTLKGIEVELEFGKPLNVKDYEDESELASASQAQVSSKYQPILPEATNEYTV